MQRLLGRLKVQKTQRIKIIQRNEKRNKKKQR